MYKNLTLTPSCHINAVGPDAFSFLQSQFSNDLRAATATSPVYGFWLDRKGRIRADSLIFRTGEENLQIISRYTAFDQLKEFLEEKIIADELELETPTVPKVLFSIWGSEHTSLPTLQEGLEPFKDPTLPTTGYSWLVTQEQATQLAATLSVTTVDENTLARDTVLAGKLRIPTDLAVDVFPQEIGLEDYVHYNKGCFLGQEIMARLRYQGRTRRTLVCFHRESSHALPESGTPLLYDGKKVGVVFRSLTDSLSSSNPSNPDSLQNTALLIAMGNWGELAHPFQVTDSTDQQWESLRAESPTVD